MNESRNRVIDLLYKYKNRQLKPYFMKTVKENNLEDVIVKETEFLPEDAKIRERLLYIEKDLNEILICKFCKTNRLKYCNNIFRCCCSSKECYKQNLSNTVKLIHEKMSEEKKRERSKKISNSSIGKKMSEEAIKKLSKRMKGKKQTLEIIKKRRESIKKYYANGGKHWSRGQTKETNASILKMSESLKRTFKENPEILINAGKKISIIMKAKIASGEFTPNITNSWTHWDCYVTLENNEKKKFRSSWEAIFWLLNKDLLYEKTRILYTSPEDNEEHTFIMDFTDNVDKILYEIKPLELMNKKINLVKIDAAKKWCDKNQYKFVLITEQWYKSNIDVIFSLDLSKHNVNIDWVNKL